VIVRQEIEMNFPNFAHKLGRRSGASVRVSFLRQTVAIGTAALLALYSIAPASAAQPSASACPENDNKVLQPGSNCQLNSPRGNVSHVVTIIFDNTRDGSTLVPSDLEQMPHLLSFMTNKGLLLSNHHTPLIAHTSDDIITILTGVYPDRHGVATAANSYLEYRANGTTGSQSGFTYWTDLQPG
jgi:hypothetical protein